MFEVELKKPLIFKDNDDKDQECTKLVFHPPRVGDLVLLERLQKDPEVKDDFWFLQVVGWSLRCRVPIEALYDLDQDDMAKILEGYTKEAKQASKSRGEEKSQGEEQAEAGAPS